MNKTRHKKSSRLFQGLLMVSIAIHLAVLLHVSGLVDFSAISYIELGLQDVSKPETRQIPRPKIRSAPPNIGGSTETKIQKMALPPVNIDPVDVSRPETMMEKIAMPKLPGVPSSTRFSASDWSLSKPSEFFTRKDYYDMLRLKIETCKQYPDMARSRQMEGKVTISFVVTSDGQVLSATIVKPSRHKSLDGAALRALHDAVPFAPPPPGLFTPPLEMEITIVFELT